MDDTFRSDNFEEVLFALKNKEYGAYILCWRRLAHLLRSVGGSLLILGLLYGSPLMWLLLQSSRREPTSEMRVEVSVTPYAQLQAPPPVAEPEKPKEPQ